MNLTIDNNDGLGDVDYTRATLKGKPLTIVRKRGDWSRCHGGLDVLGTGMPVPGSRARVTVTDGAGAVLFRGFLQDSARPGIAQQAGGGIEEEPGFFAVEEAWLTQTEPVNLLQPASVSTHALLMSDVKLVYASSMTDTVMSALATDVTVAGGREAAAYVTELFRGDGTTATFTLAHEPFREGGSETIVMDNFDDALLNTEVWTRSDPGSCLTLSAGGLAMGGGNGFDGATLLSFASPVEMGGTLVAEATGVMLNAGSDGILMGFYNGIVTHGACVAGVRVLGTAGAQSMVSIVNGVERPTAYTFAAGHSYAVRVRLHCAEMQRVLGSYQALVDGALQQFGGGVVPAPLHIVIEVADLGLASSTLPTVLFDGAIAAAPAQCVFAPVNSTALTGSIAKVSLLQKGSAWVVGTGTDGTVTTRREGAAGTGADYSLGSTGVLRFDAGRVPQPGELLTVTYRRERRAAARMKDAAADQIRLQAALPGLPSWSGSVLKPAARSTADCKAAAQALLALAGGRATAEVGEVSWTRGAAAADDVAPGDTLTLQTLDGVASRTVQSVTITDGNALPELLKYRAAFAQDRAVSLSFTVSKQLPPDTLPQTPVIGAVSGLPASLAGLHVTSATASALQIDSGTDAPAGGGFEVRRSDANFGSVVTGDLVLDSPVRSFAIPRQAFAERFFVRMYDGSAPPRYSPVSSMVLTNLPLS